MRPDLLNHFHSLLARATEGVWRREVAEAEAALDQASALLSELKQLDQTLYQQLVNQWINTAQLFEHAADYGPDQERPR